MHDTEAKRKRKRNEAMLFSLVLTEINIESSVLTKKKKYIESSVCDKTVGSEELMCRLWPWSVLGGGRVVLLKARGKGRKSKRGYICQSGVAHGFSG